MQGIRKLVTVLLAFTAPIALAAPPSSRTPKAEVFYRSFDSTSIINLDAAALSHAYDQHLTLHGSELQALLSALPNKCAAAPLGHVQDLRLLIRWSGKASWAWEASQFAYRDGRTGATCQFSHAQQAKVLAALGLQR